MDFPPHLGSMPMHAITEIHGEPGLLERFRLEVQQFDDAARARLTAALDLAAELHRDDRRVREPYLNHLLRVAIRLMHHYQVRDVDVIVAGLLHDAVEDHPVELAGGDPGTDPTGAALAGARRAVRATGGHPGRARSPTRCTTPSGTATRSTGSIWRSAWTGSRGPG